MRNPRRTRMVLIASAAIALVLLAGGAIALRTSGYDAWLRARLGGARTIADRVAEYGPAARQRLRPSFDNAGAPYPQAKIILVGLKREKRLNIYAAGSDGTMRFVRTYPIVAASGKPGPKLRNGDRQVPEGIYPVESLNPNSRFHLALRLGYPNGFDREMAAADGRTDLGSDIMIHGSNKSVGCLAMGDEAAEDLFVLAAETSIENVTVILVPHDLRQHDADTAGLPAWTRRMYDQISAELAKLPPMSPAGS